MYSIATFKRGRNTLGEIKARKKCRKHMQMSRDSVAGKAWEVGHYCLISASLTKHCTWCYKMGFLP